ncbi:MAG TPA: Flp family type IVb pilin [Chloroflexota bacterium]|nr:Flp family type IVb pilin [Chloroflexota bacterium]
MAQFNETMTRWYLTVTNAVSDQEGQGLVEYALIIAVVGVMLVGALVALRGGIGNTFSNIQAKLATNGN